MPLINMRLDKNEIEDIIKGAIRERYNLDASSIIELEWDPTNGGVDVKVAERPIKSFLKPFGDD